MEPIQEEQDPFDWIKTEITKNPDFSVVEFAEKFSLSAFSAKVIWLSCPQFQENFCRNRITISKAREGSEYGNKNWLRRRFDLSEEELEDIFTDIWNNPSDRISRRFLEIISTERIAKTQLTSKAKQELVELHIKYGTSSGTLL